MAKKKKVPFALRLLPVVFPIFETLLPKQARKAAVNLFLTPLNFPVSDKEKAFLKGHKKGTFPYQQEDISWYEWGDASHPTILVMHGWSGRLSQYYKMIPQLVAEGYHVIGFTAPAHGNSQKKKTNVVEIAEAIASFTKNRKVFAGIGHSLGGLALLYAIEKKWIAPKMLVTIAAPTIGKDVIDIFRNKIGLSNAIHEEMDLYIKAIAGEPFAYFSGVGIAKRISPPFQNHLIIHDESDQEAPIDHAYSLQKAMGGESELYSTQSLGHLKVLFDKRVSDKIVQFLKD